MRILLVLLTAAAGFAQSPYDVLARARRKVLAQVDRLPNYTCVQTLERDYLRRTSRWQGCDGPRADARSPEVESKFAPMTTDRYRLDVRVGSDAREVYSWAGASRFDTAAMDQIIGTGAVASGSFGPFLINIFGERGVDFNEDGSAVENGRKLLKFRYSVPLRASRYDYKFNGVSRFIPFDGAFWVEAETADVVRLEVHTTAMPHQTGTCEATSRVDFHRIAVAGQAYLLPRAATIDISALGGEYVNRSEFSGCRGFSAESGIRFDGEATAATRTGPAKPVQPLPRGLALTLAFEQDVDTAVAAAGDLIRARVVNDAVEKRTTNVLVPAGAIASGRIIRLEHQWAEPAHFLVAIEWESLHIRGVTTPFTAIVDSTESGFTVRAADIAHGPSRPKTKDLSGGRALLFLTSDPKFVVPRGHESKWTTR